MTDAISGEFIDLLPLTEEHAELTFAFRNSPRAAYLNSGASSVEDQARWIRNRPDGEYNFVIALKTGSCVGMVSLSGIDFHHRHAEPGRFLIGDERAVRGIPAAVEAMKLIYALAFDKLQLLRVYGTIAANNPRMIKWQCFLGMQQEGRMRSHYNLNGVLQDAVVLGMLVQEYREVALPRMQALIAAARHQPAKAASANALAPISGVLERK